MFRANRKALRLVVALLLAIAVLVVLQTSIAQAITYPIPTWWIGAVDCDDTRYYAGSGVHSYKLTTWNGLQVCGPRPIADNGPDVSVVFTNSATTEYEWECTELVKRYLLLAFNVPSKVANGDGIVSVYAQNYPDVFTSIPNDGSAQTFPKVGDVVSYDNGNGGHTAIIVVVTVTNGLTGDGLLELIEQNGSTANGHTQQQVRSWIIRGGPDSPNDTTSIVVSAWLTPITSGWTISTTTDPSTRTNGLSGVAASSSSDVWAVGSSNDYLCPGLCSYPTAYHYTGTTWSANTIPLQNVYTTLAGVTALSSSNVLVVGTTSNAYNNPYSAYAMKYNGTSWATVNVDRPGSNSWLNAVSHDSGGDVWAVGYTKSATTTLYRPLFENYNGSAFVKVNDPFTNTLGSGTDERLSAVTVLASNDAWAVGYFMDNASHKQPMACHYNGSWSCDATPTLTDQTYNITLSGVAAGASDDIWAVGSAEIVTSTTKISTFMLHWDGSSWSIVNIPSPTKDAGGSWYSDQLTSIHAESADRIYAVGYSTYDINGSYIKRPLVLAYDGSVWKLVFVPAAASNDNESFYGVVTLPDDVWAVGKRGSYTFVEHGK